MQFRTPRACLTLCSTTSPMISNLTHSPAQPLNLGTAASRGAPPRSVSTCRQCRCQASKTGSSVSNTTKLGRPGAHSSHFVSVLIIAYESASRTTCSAACSPRVDLVTHHTCLAVIRCRSQQCWHWHLELGRQARTSNIPFGQPTIRLPCAVQCCSNLDAAFVLDDCPYTRLPLLRRTNAVKTRIKRLICSCPGLTTSLLALFVLTSRKHCA